MKTMRLTALFLTLSISLMASTGLAQWGNWLELDGDGDYATISDADQNGLDITGDLTLEAWVYRESSGNQTIISKVDLPSQVSYILYINSTNHLVFGISPNGTWIVVVRSSGADTVPANTWSHVAGVYSRSYRAMRIFINGVAVGTNYFAPSSIFNSNAPFDVGAISSDNLYYFDGRIDEVRVSNVVRYINNFTPPSAPFTSDANTRGLWHFDEPVGSTSFADSSGNGNTLTGMGDAQSLPVVLSSFTATAEDEQVVLRWTTQSEVDNLGFNLYRGLSPEGAYRRINPELIRGAGNSATRHDYTYTDTQLTNGITYWYKLEDVDFAGNTTLHGPVSATPQAEEAGAKTTALPGEYQLLQNRPNPFNPATVITYQLPKEGYTSLVVYNVLGQVVCRLVDDYQPAGYYRVAWNGRDRSGRPVASGVYFCTLRAGSFMDTKKMALVR